MTLDISYTPAEEMLLRACLLDGVAALEAFAKWRALHDLDTSHDEAQHRLIPLLYTNMTKCGLQDPILPKLKAIHRLSWGSAQQRNKVVGETITEFAAAGVPVMVTKGLALGQGYYADAGQRPMSDIDLMVPAEAVVDALDLLEGQGWQNQEARLKGSARARRSYLIRTQKTCDLFWADAEPVEIAGARGLRPSPTHMLFHTIVHGLRPNVFSPVRWVADAATIGRRAGSAIDWTAFFAMARETHVAQRVYAGLDYVQSFADLGVTWPDAPAGQSLIEHFEQRAFNEIHRDGDYGTRSVIRKLVVPRILRFAMSDKVKHLPFLLTDIVERKLLHRG